MDTPETPKTEPRSLGWYSGYLAGMAHPTQRLQGLMDEDRIVLGELSTLLSAMHVKHFAAESASDAAREEAVRDIAMTYETVINDRCIGNEDEQVRDEMRNALRALGVTDAEIEAWT